MAGMPFMSGGPGTNDPGQISYRRVHLIDLVATAYNVPRYWIKAPDWVYFDSFDITAKLPRGSGQPQFRLMLQSLLAERFDLKVHIEARQQTIFALRLIKGGPKFKRATGTDEPGCKLFIRTPAPGAPPIPTHRECRNITMDAFTRELSNLPMSSIDRPVIDLTGLEGAYDFDLDFSTALDVFPQDSYPRNSSLFAVLRKQLGLRLVEHKGPGEIVVVDGGRENPTDN